MTKLETSLMKKTESKKFQSTFAGRARQKGFIVNLHAYQDEGTGVQLWASLTHIESKTNYDDVKDMEGIVPPNIIEEFVVFSESINGMHSFKKTGFGMLDMLVLWECLYDSWPYFLEAEHYYYQKDCQSKDQMIEELEWLEDHFCIETLAKKLYQAEWNAAGLTEEFFVELLVGDYESHSDYASWVILGSFVTLMDILDSYLVQSKLTPFDVGIDVKHLQELLQKSEENCPDNLSDRIYPN